MIGRNQIESGNFIWTSKDGQFRIESKHYASGRNGHFNTVVYNLTDTQSGEQSQHDTLSDARFEADLHVDPNWDG
jgi:hypothetical protein